MEGAQRAAPRAAAKFGLGRCERSFWWWASLGFEAGIEEGDVFGGDEDTGDHPM